MTKTFADLTGSTAMVTGASCGIGRAIALELARGGADVLVHYARSEDSARSIVQEIRQMGLRSDLIQADLRDADCQEFVDRAWDLLGGGIDIWVNNAGADLLTGTEARLSYDAKLRQLWEVDVQGTVHLSRLAARRMREQGGGALLNVGWDQADRGMEGESAELFSTSKNAIMGFTRSLALSVAPEVRVNCIAPGWIRTAWGEQAGAKWQERVIRETPLRRWGEPEDVAKMARFLLSPEASYITGQVINVNGGAVR